MSETTILPRSRIIRVQFDLALPADATPDEVLEWVTFNLWGGVMEDGSALDPYGVDAISEPVLTDTHMHLHEEAIVRGDGSTAIRHWLDERPFTGKPAMDAIVEARRTQRPGSQP